MIAVLLARYTWQLAAGAGIVVAFLAWDSSRVRHGERRMAQKVEQANAVVVKKADGAARKSGDPSARGVLDPYGAK